MSNKIQGFISLYDYLGKPAGGELAKRVFTKAKKTKQKYKIKILPFVVHEDEETKTVIKRVIAYKRSFLNEYFKK